MSAQHIGERWQACPACAEIDRADRIRMAQLIRHVPIKPRLGCDRALVRGCCASEKPATRRVWYWLPGLNAQGYVDVCEDCAPKARHATPEAP